MTRNGLHIDTRTAEERYADGHAQGIKDYAEVEGNADAVERRITFCAKMAEAHEGSALGDTFLGRLAGLREAKIDSVLGRPMIVRLIGHEGTAWHFEDKDGRVVRLTAIHPRRYPSEQAAIEAAAEIGLVVAADGQVSTR